MLQISLHKRKIMRFVTKKILSYRELCVPLHRFSREGEQVF